MKISDNLQLHLSVLLSKVAFHYRTWLKMLQLLFYSANISWQSTHLLPEQTSVLYTAVWVNKTWNSLVETFLISTQINTT